MKKILITGNVGKDPEQRSTQSGDSYVTFSVGVSVGTKQNPKTDWVNISCNGKLGDIAAQYVRKGSKVLIEGFPTVNAYINKDNKPIGTLVIYANNLELLNKVESNNQDDGSGDNYTLPESDKQLNAEDLNSIPF